GWAMTTTPWAPSGRSPIGSGAGTWCRPAVTGGSDFTPVTTCTGPRARRVMDAIPLLMTSTPRRSQNGMSAASAAMVRAATTSQPPRPPTSLTPHAWTPSLRPTPASSATPRGQRLNNPIDGGYYGWPVGYRVGLRLQDFWKLEETKLGQA